MSVMKEMKVISFLKGVKLLSSDNTTFKNACTVEDLLKLPFCIYFLDTHGNNVMVNDEDARYWGFDSAEHAIGKSILDTNQHELLSALINNSQQVMDSGVASLCNENFTDPHDKTATLLTLKLPLYDESNHIIGILGASIALEKHSLADSLTQLSILGLLTEEKLKQFEVTDVNLSRKETQCLQLLLEKNTAKEIGLKLNISYRTVEEHISNIRHKFGVNTKAELLSKLSRRNSK